MSQLLRYFTVTDARFGILTDGITYRFFSDLDQPNMMDPKPFFEFNMLDFTEPQVEELKRFSKAAFDMTENVDAARELKYTTEIKRVLADELACPSDDLFGSLSGVSMRAGSPPKEYESSSVLSRTKRLPSSSTTGLTTA